VPVSATRRFSQAISEGDGISLIARIGNGDDPARLEEQGAEALLLPRADGPLERARAATSLPIAVYWRGESSGPPPGADACVIDADSGRELVEWLEHRGSERFELAFRVADEDEFERLLEEFDPELFVLAAPDAQGEEALERTLDLLPEVPAGKLAIAELPESSRADVSALERAGFDGVIVEARRVAELVEDAPPEV
jgi:hypothetical protein